MDKPPRRWSLRLKLTLLLVGLVTASILGASALHGWFALRALTEDVRGRAAAIASQVAYGISAQELADPAMLSLEIRNILAARASLRWLDVYANTPQGLVLLASTRRPSLSAPPDLARQAVAERRTLTAPAPPNGEEAWVAAAPVIFDRVPRAVVALALSHEGAE